MELVLSCVRCGQRQAVYLPDWRGHGDCGPDHDGFVCCNCGIINLWPEDNDAAAEYKFVLCDKEPHAVDGLFDEETEPVGALLGWPRRK